MTLVSSVNKNTISTFGEVELMAQYFFLSLCLDYHSFFFFLVIFMGVFWLYWDRTVESIAWRERGIELNSGRRERSCTICWRTKHEAIGADRLS